MTFLLAFERSWQSRDRMGLLVGLPSERSSLPDPKTPVGATHAMPKVFPYTPNLVFQKGEVNLFPYTTWMSPPPRPYAMMHAVSISSDCYH